MSSKYAPLNGGDFHVNSIGGENVAGQYRGAALLAFCAVNEISRIVSRSLFRIIA